MPHAGVVASYSVASTIDLAALLAGTKGQKVWGHGKPLDLRIIAAPRAWSVHWSDARGTELFRLLSGAGGGARLIDMAKKTVRTLGTLPDCAGKTRADV